MYYTLQKAIELNPNDPTSRHLIGVWYVFSTIFKALLLTVEFFKHCSLPELVNPR